MKVTCPHCQEKLTPKAIKNINKNGIYVAKQCPSCDSWFSLSKPLTILKILGISLLLLTSLLNMFDIKSEYNLIFSGIGFAGILVAILITFLGKNEKVDKQSE